MARNQNEILRFAGGQVDFDLAGNLLNDFRVVDGIPPSYVPNDMFNICLIGLQADAYTTYPPYDNSQIIITHGDGYNIDERLVTMPSIPNDVAPLAYVYYYKTGGIVDPIIDLVEMSGTRFSYEFSISNVDFLTDGDAIVFEVDLSAESFSSSDVINTLFKAGDPLDLLDSNTQPIRREIDNTSYDSGTKIATIRVTDSFTGIELARNPQVRSFLHLPLIEDLRGFIDVYNV